MNIRRAEGGDAHGLAQQMKVVVDEGRWLGTESGRTVEELVHMFSASLQSRNIIFILECEARIVGGISLHSIGVEGVNGLGMSILREFRGQGWGRRLVETAIEAARTAAVRKVVLEVFSDNGRAVALYASSEFEVEGLKRDHYPRRDGSVKSTILMARFLQPRPVAVPVHPPSPVV